MNHLRRFTLQWAVFWTVAVAFALEWPAPAIVAGKADAKTAAKNREAIEAGLLGGGTVVLPVGETTIDRALLLGPQHSGGVLKGTGPGCILRNGHSTANGENATVSLNGLGVNYFHSASVSADALAYVLSETVPGTAIPWNHPSAQAGLLKPGNVVYAFTYDSYQTQAPPLPRKRFVVGAFDPATRRLMLASDKPDPALLALKWLDGSPTADVAAGDRVVRMVRPADAGGYAPGRYVYVTDGPTRGNEATGEHRRVLASDATAGTVTLDEPVSRAYTLPALACVQPVAGFTLQKLTLAQPAHPQANPWDAKWCADLKADRVRFLTPDDPPYTGAAFGSSARVLLADCEAFGGVGLNGCQDVLVDGGVYAGIHGEESCTVCAIRNCTVRANPRQITWAPHGIVWDVGSDKLRVERVRIEGFGPHPVMVQTWAVASDGPGLLLRDVTIVSRGWPQAALSLKASGTIDRLVSDGPVYFWSGKPWKVEDSSALFWDPKPGTGGVMTGTTPKPAPTPGWVVKD